MRNFYPERADSKFSTGRPGVNYECPICGTWEGPRGGDGIFEKLWCDECFERANCKECQEEVMDEKEAFCPPYDPQYECEVEPDFDAEDDE